MSATSVQAVNKISSLQLNNVLQLCKNRGFFRGDCNDLKRFVTGPNGALLWENLRKELLFSTVINRTVNVFLNTNSNNELDTFNYAKNICQDKLPFGIATLIDESNGDGSIKGSLINATFVSAANSVQYFHRWQKQRRMWWRKFSANPGRYALTDLTTDDSNNQTVQISAEYPWGKQITETLALRTDSPFSETQFKDGRKKVTAHVIESRIDFSGTLLNTLCDAYDEPLYRGHPRPLLRFHRKLAPYKIAFSINAVQDASTVEELNQLSLYLGRQLREGNVSTLLLPLSLTENRWKDYDELGIPYCVVLSETTLRNGIAHLRNRDTTLKEQIHVTELPKYVEQLFKNY